MVWMEIVRPVVALQLGRLEEAEEVVMVLATRATLVVHWVALMATVACMVGMRAEATAKATA